MHDSDFSALSDVRGRPGGAGAGRRDLRDRIIGLFGVLFYGIWMILFGVGTILMAAILATGANNPARTSLVAILCAALSSSTACGFAVRCADYAGSRVRHTR